MINKAIVENDPLFEQPRLQELFNAPVKKVRKVREADVEKDHIASVRAAGGESYKFVSPSKRAVPDRLDLYGTIPMAEIISARFGLSPDSALQEARILLEAAIRFTEAKRPGEKPTPAQEREHGRLRALGFTVNVVDQRKKP